MKTYIVKHFLMPIKFRPNVSIAIITIVTFCLGSFTANAQQWRTAKFYDVTLRQLPNAAIELIYSYENSTSTAVAPYFSIYNNYESKYLPDPETGRNNTIMGPKNIKVSHARFVFSTTRLPTATTQHPVKLNFSMDLSIDGKTTVGMYNCGSYMWDGTILRECDKYGTIIKRTESGVVINGVTWATCNVNEPGTFVSKPEGFGRLYQWNRRRAWEAYGTNMLGWNGAEPSGITWTKANDPSPAGWRIPTLDEIKSLCDKGKVTSEWAILNGVKGRKFIDKITGNSIFLPAVGSRDQNFGTLHSAGTHGYYWSNMQPNCYDLAYGLSFSGDGYAWGNIFRRSGLSVRSVKE